MLQLSQKAKYALSFVNFLSKEKTSQHISLRKISQKTGLPYRFLSTIAVDLKKAGMVDSKEGKGGGYFLAKKLTQINLNDMIIAVDKDLGLVDCQRDVGCSQANTCKSKQTWDKLQIQITQILKNYTVADFI
jgi:Rrf2 family protein